MRKNDVTEAKVANIRDDEQTIRRRWTAIVNSANYTNTASLARIDLWRLS